MKTKAKAMLMAVFIGAVAWIGKSYIEERSAALNNEIAANEEAYERAPRYNSMWWSHYTIILSSVTDNSFSPAPGFAGGGGGSGSTTMSQVTGKTYFYNKSWNDFIVVERKDGRVIATTYGGNTISIPEGDQ